jgi:hypothetical protein
MPKIGISNNPSGRKKGSPNKRNIALRTSIQNILEQRFDTFIADMDSLNPVQRTKLFIDLLSFVLPRLESIPVSESELKIENLSDSALEQLTQHIKKQSI